MSAGCRSSFGYISLKYRFAVETTNGIRRFDIAVADYYAEFYSPADAPEETREISNENARREKKSPEKFNRHERFVFNKTDSIDDCNLTIVRICSLLPCARTVDG